MTIKFLHASLIATTLVLAGQIPAQEEPALRIDFSVHLLPPQQAIGNAELGVIDDLHYAYGDIEVPLHLKEGRQSILYPYAGPLRLTLFRVVKQDGKSIRQSVCYADIPSGTAAAVLVLQRSGENCRVKPFWFSKADLKEPGFLINISQIPIGIQLAKNQQVLLPPGNRMTLHPEFSREENHAYLFLEAFVSEPRDDTSRIRKVLECNLFFPKGDTQLNLLIPRNRLQISFVNLSTRGIPNRSARSELERLIPAPKIR